VETYIDPTFGVQVPCYVPNVPDEVLNPRETWADKSAYDVKAADLARRFTDNFKQYADQAGLDVLAAGPKI
jgi:phosphoenolpyruvate carboxykinase (ATP)